MILQNGVVFDPCFATARGSAHEAFQIAKNPTFNFPDKNRRTASLFVRNNAEKYRKCHYSKPRKEATTTTVYRK